MRHRALGTLGTAGLLLLTLTLSACGSSGQSGTKTTPSKSSSAAAGGQACQAVAGDALVALEDDKKLQTVDNIIPAVNAKAASQPLLDALNKVSAALDTAKLVDLNKQTDIDHKTSPNVAKDFVAAEGLTDGLSGGSGKIAVQPANQVHEQRLGAAHRHRRDGSRVVVSHRG